MKQERSYPKVYVTNKAERAVKGGHPWVYGEEIRRMEGTPENGGLVDVLAGSAYLGTGFYNDASKITVRLISRSANDRFDAAFWRRRVEYALRYRRTVMPGSDFKCCRLIHGEADQMPGLTVDRYDTILSVQVLSLGMERVKDVVFAALLDVLREMGEDIRGIYERNDVSIRLREGLEEGKGWYPIEGLPAPESAVTEIVENGVSYLVDVENGQKTGFFLDQKYNRAAVARHCRRQTGAGLLHPHRLLRPERGYGRRGARHQRGHLPDRHRHGRGKRPAQRAWRAGWSFQCANVFDLLHRAERAEVPTTMTLSFWTRRPSPSPARRSQSAIRGYREINRRAMKLLPRGGYLATCSCSHFMTDELFRKMLASAAADAAVSLRQIEARRADPDHPILWNVPETDYLKFYIFQVV